MNLKKSLLVFLALFLIPSMPLFAQEDQEPPMEIPDGPPKESAKDPAPKEKEVELPKNPNPPVVPQADSSSSDWSDWSIFFGGGYIAPLEKHLDTYNSVEAGGRIFLGIGYRPWSHLNFRLAPLGISIVQVKTAWAPGTTMQGNLTLEGTSSGAGGSDFVTQVRYSGHAGLQIPWTDGDGDWDFSLPTYNFGWDHKGFLSHRLGVGVRYWIFELEGGYEYRSGDWSQGNSFFLTGGFVF